MKKCCFGLFLIGLLVGFNALGEARLLTGDANNNLHSRDSYVMDLSADGTLVLFASGPPVTGSTPGITQGGLYIRNLVSNTLTFTGSTNVGGEGSFSDDGRYVAWTSPESLIFWRDCQANITRSITPTADGACRVPIVSANGRYVAYVSVARNLVTTTNLLPANGRAAIYLYDSQSQTTTVASVTYDGKGLSTGVGRAPGFEFNFSANGQYVFFSTDSTNVHPTRLALAAGSQVWFWVYRRNLTNGAVDIVCQNVSNAIPSGNFTTPLTDATGNRVLFVGSAIGVFGGPLTVPGYMASFGSDLYLKDLASGGVWWVSKTTNNTAPDAAFGAGGLALSGDGRVAAFSSTGTKFNTDVTDPPGASDPWDVFRVDIGPSGSVTNTLVSKPVVGTNNVGVFSGPLISGNGNYVTFNTVTHYPLIGVGETQSFYRQGFGVGVLPASGSPSAPPPLKFAFAPGQLSLSWPTTAGVNLYFKTNLTDATWNLVTNTPVQSGGTNTVTLLPTGARRFFVLRSP